MATSAATVPEQIRRLALHATRGSEADSIPASRPADREAPPLALGAEISLGPDSPPAPPAAQILEPLEPLTVSTARINEATPSCACGSGAPTPIANKSDRLTGAIAGHPQKFLKGH